jgi:hypothetical protein
MRHKKKKKIMLKKEVFHAGEIWWFGEVSDLRMSWRIYG